MIRSILNSKIDIYLNFIFLFPFFVWIYSILTLIVLFHFLIQLYFRLFNFFSNLQSSEDDLHLFLSQKFIIAVAEWVGDKILFNFWVLLKLLLLLLSYFILILLFLNMCFGDWLIIFKGKLFFIILSVFFFWLMWFTLIYLFIFFIFINITY